MPFLAATRRDCVRVFDVNLRKKPFYTRGVLEDSLGKATILKLNDAEMPEVLKLLKLAGAEFADPANPIHLLFAEEHRRCWKSFPCNMVCITMGGGGSLLVDAEIFRSASWNTDPGSRHHRRRRRLHRRAHQLLSAGSAAAGAPPQ